MRFLWPEMLWLLLLVPVLVAAYIAALRRRKRLAVRYASLSLVREALGPGHRIRRHIPPLLLLLGVTTAIFALARPSASVVLPSQYMTIAMAMDVSLSMRATDVEPSRLVAAQNAAKAFIDELPPTVRLGIVSFAGTAAVVQTPTENKADMTAAIDRFQLQRATATGSGLILALGLLFPDDGLDLESVAMSMRHAGVSLDSARKARSLHAALPLWRRRAGHGLAHARRHRVVLGPRHPRRRRQEDRKAARRLQLRPRRRPRPGTERSRLIRRLTR